MAGDTAMEQATERGRALLQQYPAAVACLVMAHNVNPNSLHNPTHPEPSPTEVTEGTTILDAQRDGKPVKVQIIDWSEGARRWTESVRVSVSVWDADVPPATEVTRSGRSRSYQPRIEATVAGSPSSSGQFREFKLIEPPGGTDYNITESLRDIHGRTDGDTTYVRSTPSGAMEPIPESGLPPALRNLQERANCFGM